MSFRIAGCIGVLTMIAACAPPPPAPLQGEVIYNKFGEPEGCEDGRYIFGVPATEQCLPPLIETEYCDDPLINDPDCPPRLGNDAPPRRGGAVGGFR